MTDTEQELKNIIMNPRLDDVPSSGYLVGKEKIAALLALLQQSNREYADRLIGKDTSKEEHDHYNAFGWCTGCATNRLRAELRKKNNPDPDTGGDT